MTAAVLCAGLILGALVSTPAKPDQQKPGEPNKNEPPPPQEQEPIQLGSRLVNVPFSVTDKRNAFLNDIRQEEIQVLENGRPQEIFQFARLTDLPLTIAVLIDISGSQQFTLPDEKAAASRFLRSFVRPDKDVVAIVEFRDQAILVQDFTSTLERLERGLEKIRYTPATTNDNTSKFGGTSLYDAVHVVCEDLLTRQAGRRTIILLSDGEDTTSQYRLPDAVDRAIRSEVTIYSIGIGDRFRFNVDEGTLKKLSDQTGGRAYFPKDADSLLTAFRQIEEDLRDQYLVAYYPSNTALDGTFRKIEIRVPGRKDIRVRHRFGYYAPKPQGE
jgi:VWFA-related protein